MRINAANAAVPASRNAATARVDDVVIGLSQCVNARLHRRPKAVRCKLMLDGLAAVELMPHLGHSEPEQLC
jgi:hypothetical protein